jgi:hypothetical protein
MEGDVQNAKNVEMVNWKKGFSARLTFPLAVGFAVFPHYSGVLEAEMRT